MPGMTINPKQISVSAAGADREFTLQDGDGPRRQSWHFPSRTECMVCHSRAANYVLGLSTPQMNREHVYRSGQREPVAENQLRVLERLGSAARRLARRSAERQRADGSARGLEKEALDDYVRRQTATNIKLEPKWSSMLYRMPEQYDRLVDPSDATQSLDLRARSYLHANCAQCHVEAGGGNARLEMEFTTAADKTNLFDVKPVHHAFDIADARVIASGKPDRSVLLRRMSTRGAGQMPPLATSLVDRAGVRLMHDWIEKLSPSQTVGGPTAVAK